MMEDLVCFGVTDRGLKRENNQDAFFIGRLSKSILVGANSLDITADSRLFGEIRGCLMLVADGMGGHAGGAKASRMAIDFLIDRLLNNVHWFLRFSPEAEADFVKSLQALLVETHHQIQAEGRRDQSVSGMGTTLTMTYAVWPNLYVLHAGDSRCYLIRDGHVEQLTNDHTMARRLVEAGGMHPKDAVKSRWSNVLWNVLGAKAKRKYKPKSIRPSSIRATAWCSVLTDCTAMLTITSSSRRSKTANRARKPADDSFVSPTMKGGKTTLRSSSPNSPMISADRERIRSSMSRFGLPTRYYLLPTCRHPRQIARVVDRWERSLA